MPSKNDSEQSKTGRKRKPGRPKQRRISEAHKRAISEANKAHWARRKAVAKQGGLKEWFKKLLGI